MSGTLERIWIKRAKRGPMDPVDDAELVTGRGLVHNADQGGRRQVTLVDRARWDQATAGFATPVDPIVRRANLLVSGVDLEQSRGRTLRIGSCRIRLLGETRPCERMEEARAGLRAALEPHWGGGAYGEVLGAGTIRIGDRVEWVTDTTAEGR
jgi:MOSC domain-containing protein YiiM